MVLLRLRLLSNEPRLALGLICGSWWGYFSRWRAECMRSLVNWLWSWEAKDSGSSARVVIALRGAGVVVLVVVVVDDADETDETDEAEDGGTGQVCNSKLRGAAAKLSWGLSDLAPAPVAMVAVSVPGPSLPPRHGPDRERDLNKRRTGRSSGAIIMTMYLNN